MRLSILLLIVVIIVGGTFVFAPVGDALGAVTGSANFCSQFPTYPECTGWRSEPISDNFWFCEYVHLPSMCNNPPDPQKQIVPISAINSDGVDLLLELLKKQITEGPKYFPDDMYTDQPEIFLVSELIREKIFILTREEIPYKSAVRIEEFKENPNKKIIRISAEIYVERKNHKGIIIGKNGEMLKRIGSDAREEIERILGTKIFLELWVKVKENWTQSDHHVKEFGYGNLS